MWRLWFIHLGKKRHMPEMHDLWRYEWMFLKLLPVVGKTGGTLRRDESRGRILGGLSPDSHQNRVLENFLAAGETGGLCSRTGGRG